MESIQSLLEQASEATIAVKRLSDDKKEDILRALAAKLRANIVSILAENQLDLDRMPDTDPKKDRLLLTCCKDRRSGKKRGRDCSTS
jgi:glutamate-5-semialdehyde dehydrogenase